MSGWTRADGAELDVLVFGLVSALNDHRARGCRYCVPSRLVSIKDGRPVCPEVHAWEIHLTQCRPCKGDAPLTFGSPCERRAGFLAHSDTCGYCNPCPHLKRAIDVVIRWREGRLLLSEAQHVRAELEALA